MSLFRKKTKTEKKYSAWKWTHRTLCYGSYPISAVPLAVYSGVNWNDWLKQTNAFSLGWGFGTAVLGVLVMVLGLTTFDEIISKKISKLVTFGVGIFIIGASFVMLAELYKVLGYMLLCVGGGIMGGGISTTIDKEAIKPIVNRYQETLKGTKIDKEGTKREKIRQQAIKDGILPTE